MIATMIIRPLPPASARRADAQVDLEATLAMSTAQPQALVASAADVTHMTSQEVDLEVLRAHRVSLHVFTVHVIQVTKRFPLQV